MRRQPDVFQQTIAQFQSQTGLRLDAPAPTHSVRVMVDDICVALTDSGGTQMMLEAEIIRLSESREERTYQLYTALKANLGLVFDCSATVQRSQSEDGEYLVARAVLPYTVTASSKLMKTIEDIAGLVDFIRRTAVQVDHPAAQGPHRHPNLIFPV
ncbi:hypothetical protein GCM10011385_18510 [Nitratireductor aestuarii]|uniref:Tir chaperone protein (CesT) family protein n=1 Tax=Nitratireductor aestuarii TaxID=1735103 RepID=A0A916RS42_9HYPH|nr:hypothetical protein [Nitratireductor aestuarii]GGA65014.1 hypothetical protein GCM10011385_18510 [Nitratireductor aestuarii]